MNIVKRSKDSNLPQLQKRLFPSWTKELRHLISAMLLASLLGTYLDLFFVGKGLYSFPIRPLPAIFSIHIAFTLVVLPVFAAVFLVVCNRLKSWKKAGLIILLSLIIAVAESWAESNGLLVHHQSWEHHYSFFGYMMFLTIIYSFYAWLK